MIKVYTLFFLLFFSIIAKSEALADGDSVINPLDTITFQLIKDDLIVPQQVVDLLVDIEKMLNGEFCESELGRLKLNEIEVAHLMSNMEDAIANNDLNKEEVYQSFIDLSANSLDKLISYKSNSNKIHVYQYIGNTPEKGSIGQSENQNFSKPTIVIDNYFAPERNIVSIIFLKDNEYVASKKLLLMNINKNLKIIKLQ